MFFYGRMLELLTEKREERAVGALSTQSREEAMQFRIETVKKRATVSFPDNTQMSGCFFVSTVSALGGGEELVSELLAKNREYLPFESDEGKTVLLRKENLVVVCLAEDATDNALPGYKRVPVVIHLLTGQIMNGKVSFAQPETQSRLSDFLNSRDAFFPF